MTVFDFLQSNTIEKRLKVFISVFSKSLVILACLLGCDTTLGYFAISNSFLSSLGQFLHLVDILVGFRIYASNMNLII